MIFHGEKPSGFASPAQGYEEQYIDLNRLLVKNRPATYFFKLDSRDMEQLGLPMGALLVVDRSKRPKNLKQTAMKTTPRDVRETLLQEANPIVIIRKQSAMKTTPRDVRETLLQDANPIVIIRHEGQFFCRLMARHNEKIVFTNGTDDIIPTNDDTEIIGLVTASIKLYDISY